MLVMRRRAGQRVQIGDSIEIEILEARNNSVKLGICAPESVAVTRKESQLTRSSNLTAAQSTHSPSAESALLNLLKQL